MDCPIKNGGSFHSYVSLPEGTRVPTEELIEHFVKLRQIYQKRWTSSKDFPHFARRFPINIRSQGTHWGVGCTVNAQWAAVGQVFHHRKATAFLESPVEMRGLEAWNGEPEKTNAMVSRVYVEHVDMIYAVHSYRYTFAGNYLCWKKGYNHPDLLRLVEHGLLLIHSPCFSGCLRQACRGGPRSRRQCSRHRHYQFNTRGRRKEYRTRGRSRSSSSCCGSRNKGSSTSQEQNRNRNNTFQSDNTHKAFDPSMHSQLCLHYALVALGR